MTQLLIIRQTPAEFTTTYPCGTELDGWTPKMDICKLDKTVVLTLTESDGFEVNIPDRQLIGKITADQPEALELGDYIADIVWLEDGVVVDRTPVFPIRVIDSVTDATA